MPFLSVRAKFDKKAKSRKEDLTGRLSEEELVQVVESEDVPHGEISGAAPLTSNGARP